MFTQELSQKSLKPGMNERSNLNEPVLEVLGGWRRY